FTAGGGSFEIPLNSVARYDGSTWNPLGLGIGDSAYVPFVYSSCADSSGSIYFGGDFDRAGGGKVSNISMWGGDAWFDLDQGTDGPVTALSYHDGLVCMVGDFTQ